MSATSDENGQIKQKSSWGGKRPGAGRKPMYGGEEVTRKMRRKFCDYITEEEIEAVMASAIADAMNGKPEMVRFVLDQVFGKATQRQEHTGADGASLVFQIAEQIAKKHDIALPEAERNSEE